MSLIFSLWVIIRHRWTGRFEAHLWDKSSWNNIQNKKGRQGNFYFFSQKIVIKKLIKPQINKDKGEKIKEICYVFLIII